MGPGHPHFRPPQHPQHPQPPQHPHHPYPPGPPPFAAKPAVSPLVIGLIVAGAVLAVGAGSCVLIGGLAVLGASAAPDPAASSVTPSLAPATSAAPAATTLTPLGDDDDDAPPAATAATAATPAAAQGTAPAAAATGTTAAGSAGGGTWTCNASGSVRVCGFANVCSNQMVFGSGLGKDRFLANSQAKNACEGMARAKGGFTTCVVQCTLR